MFVPVYKQSSAESEQNRRGQGKLFYSPECARMSWTAYFERGIIWHSNGSGGLNVTPLDMLFPKIN